MARKSIEANTRTRISYTAPSTCIVINQFWGKGLTLQAINSFAMERDLLGAVFFVLSLGFKQMALYYAPAIGAYLLAKCFYIGSVAG